MRVRLSGRDPDPDRLPGAAGDGARRVGGRRGVSFEPSSTSGATRTSTATMPAHRPSRRRVRSPVCGARDGSRCVDDGDPDAIEVPVADSRTTAAAHPAEPVLPARHAGQRGLEGSSPTSRPASASSLTTSTPDLPVRLEHGDVDGPRRLHERVRGLPRLHAPGHLLLPGPQHPGPVRVRLPPGHGRAAGPRADGLRGLDGGLAGRPLVDLRPAQQPAAQGRVVIGRAATRRTSPWPPPSAARCSSR